MNDPIQEAWDRFAAAALTGITQRANFGIGYAKVREAATDAADYADAMLRERKARAERRGTSR